MWSPSRAAQQSERKRKSAAFTFLNLWPFAAIMVVLVALFLFRYVPVVDYGGPPADLPKSKTAVEERGANREDSIHILVTRDGAAYIDRKFVRLDDLAHEVQNAVRDGAEKKVYISADARAKHGDVERVVDELRHAGITEISFITN